MISFARGFTGDRRCETVVAQIKECKIGEVIIE